MYIVSLTWSITWINNWNMRKKQISCLTGGPVASYWNLPASSKWNKEAFKRSFTGSGCVCVCVCVFFEAVSHFVTQAGVQWYDHGSWQSWPPGFKQSSHLSISKGANFLVVFVETEFWYVAQDGLDLLTSCSALLGLPQYWDYRPEPPHLALRMAIFKTQLQ